MTRFNGYLFSKLHLIGSKSEGPSYFLQQFDYKETAIIKQTSLWQEDPALHKFLARKVTVEGQLTLNGIVYEEVKDYQSVKAVEEENKLIVDLRLGNDVLMIKKTPPAPITQECMELTLLVKWPFRSIWEGRCPTSQIYDLTIEHNGNIIWRWSDDKVFMTVITPVYIPGGDFHEFTEVWKINPDDVEVEGTYTARAIFIASGQEVSKDFEIEFIR